MNKGQSKEMAIEVHTKEQKEIKEWDSQNVFQCTNQDTIY